MTSPVPLWTILRSREEFGGEGLPLLTVRSDSGVGLRDLSEGRQPSEELTSYRRVETGDLVVNKLWARFGAYGVASDDGVISPAYWVMKIDQATAYPRYLHYLLRSSPYVHEVGRVSKNQPPNGYELPWSQFRKIDVDLRSMEEQRRIAGFLDAETTRIDKLAELRSIAFDRLAEREAAELDAVLDELGDKFGFAPLRRFLLGVDQGSSPLCDAIPAEDDEWGVLKVSCLRPGRFNPRENKRLPEDRAASVAHEVHEGDLLITRANTPQLVGSTAVVPPVRRGLLLSDKLFRVHLDDRFAPEFVAVVARGKRIRDICAAVSNGASQSMANIRFEEVKAWPLPLADPVTQADVVARVTRQTRWIDSIRQRIEHQTKLLSERRQALITAAVTGEFDVSAASGRGIEE